MGQRSLMSTKTPQSSVRRPDPVDKAADRTLARHPVPLGGDTARATLGTSTLSLTGMVLDNGPGNHSMRIGKKPDWLRAKVPGGERYLQLKALINEPVSYTHLTLPTILRV